MTTAALVQLADAIVADLNAGTFDQDFEAVRSYADWEDELQDLDELHVDVVPVRHVQTDMDGRESIRYRMSVDIGIRKRFVQADQNSVDGRIALAEVDALVLLVEQLNEHFCKEVNQSPTDFTEATWYSSEIRATYVRQHLRQFRQFTGIIRVTYEYVKELA